MTLHPVGVVGDRQLRLSQGIFRRIDLEDINEGDIVRVSSPFGAYDYRLSGIEHEEDLSLAWLDMVDDPPSSCELPRGER